MGSDSAPFMTNLFVYHYESRGVKSLKKNSLQRARRFNHTFRFIDDLLTINDRDEFVSSFKEIYPVELQLNLESFGDKVLFLDLEPAISALNSLTKEMLFLSQSYVCLSSLVI